jgi:D-arabinose 1-dehydrogenase-like Zn-dependent alcohol dehydrogenase
LATGVTAYNAVLKIESGSSIAVVGTGSLAYLTTQYGKKAKDLHITIFGYEGDENLAKEWGADRFIALSSQSL